MHASVVLALAFAVSLFACKSQSVQKAASCSDPCCGGHAALVDCGENPDVTCTESGDPCVAQSFGCSGGMFFKTPQASLPANCSAIDSGAATDDATEPLDATVASDDASDSPDSADDGPLFACGDASCSAATQYCRHTVGGAPPGIDTQACEPLDQGQSTCAPDAPFEGCQCTGDAGGLYVRCDVP